MAGRGRKDCPNCNTEIGARSHVCSCGYHFPSGEIRKDLIKSTEPVGPKTYKELGRGRKQCPDCDIILGGVTKICHKCNFDFVLAKKEKDAEVSKNKEEKKTVEKVEEKISSVVKELLTLPRYVAPVKLSPKDHAKRILSYGARRANTLLAQARVHKCWSHVDWEIVKQGLVKI